jgi:hypothetical protein
MEVDKITDLIAAINSVAVVVDKGENISSALKACFRVSSSDFVLHMTEATISNPRRLSHMYEWNRAGDPNARLWKQNLRGGGKNRRIDFEFKASRKIVPVPDELKAVGVEQRHVFYWKAPIMEYGLPVVISPKVAKVLVYLKSAVKNPSTGAFVGWNSGGVVYRRSPVHIERAGTPEQWGAFTEEYNSWWSSDKPEASMEKSLGRKNNQSVKDIIENKIREINRKKSVLSLTPVAYDSKVGAKLQAALDNNYAAASKNRMVENG